MKSVTTLGVAGNYKGALVYTTLRIHRLSVSLFRAEPWISFTGL